MLRETCKDISIFFCIYNSDANIYLPSPPRYTCISGLASKLLHGPSPPSAWKEVE